MFDTSIIIVNYNTCRITAECVENVMRNTHDIRYEIILVDNASTDGSKEYFSSLQGIKYIYNTENVGFGRANNIGIRHASGRNILFLNSDTLLVGNAIAPLSRFLDDNPDVGICGGNLLSDQGKPIHSFSPLPTLREVATETLFLSHLVHGKNISHNLTGKPREVGYITGADMMVRREALNKCGAFDPDFFMYYEEVELTFRIRRAGYKVYSVPESRIIHLEGGSLRTSESKERMMAESLDILLSKLYTPRKKQFYISLFKADQRVRAFIFSILRNKDRADFHKQKLRLTSEKFK